MRKLILHIVAVFALSLVFTSCSKEEVKPFASNGSGIIQRDDEVTTDNSANETTTGDEEVGDEEEGDGGITDGGNSSDYDSKGTKKKNK